MFFLIVFLFLLKFSDLFVNFWDLLMNVRKLLGIVRIVLGNVQTCTNVRDMFGNCREWFGLFWDCRELFGMFADSKRNWCQLNRNRLPYLSRHVRTFNLDQETRNISVNYIMQQVDINLFQKHVFCFFTSRC